MRFFVSCSNISNEGMTKKLGWANELAKHPEIKSVDVCTGDCELILKVRTKTMLSLKQVKTEGVVG